jgi:hypothetical protein
MTLATTNGDVRLTSLDVLNDAALTGRIDTAEFKTAVDEVLRQEARDMLVAALTGSPAVYEAALLSPVYVPDDEAATGEFYTTPTEEGYGGLADEHWTEDGVATFSSGTGPTPTRIALPPVPRIRLESTGARYAFDRRYKGLREERCRVLLVMRALDVIRSEMDAVTLFNNYRPLVRGFHDLPDLALTSIFRDRTDVLPEDRRGFLFGTFFDLHEDPLMHDRDRERAYGELTGRFKAELDAIEAQLGKLSLRM